MGICHLRRAGPGGVGGEAVIEALCRLESGACGSDVTQKDAAHCLALWLVLSEWVRFGARAEVGEYGSGGGGGVV